MDRNTKFHCYHYIGCLLPADWGLITLPIDECHQSVSVYSDQKQNF